MEPGLLQGIREELLTEKAVHAAVKAAHRVINEQQPKDNSKRIDKLRGEVENLTDAIASGALKSSPALATRLVKAESELTDLEAAPKATKLMPGIVDEYKAWVRDLETVLSPEGPKRPCN